MKTIVSFFLIISSIAFSQEQLKHEVYFDTDKYDVPKIEQQRLLLFIKKLDTVKIEKISIFGFCDDIGSNAYNLKLSQQRADVIKELFSNHEIDESIINNVDGKGEVLLKIVNTKDVNVIRGLNRKSEIIVFLKPPQPKVVEEKKEKKKSLNDELAIGDKIVLENILFKRGYRTIAPESIETLEKIAAILSKKEKHIF